ncbi:MAG: hypothetical protein DMF90_06025, partial [Acidobacteria bacterium]
LERAVALYRGDLLPDCDDEWIRPERERLQRRFGESLVALIAKLEDDRALGDAIDYAQRLLNVDPLNETTWRTLMRCHGKRGERATALHVYQQCASVLKRELGVQPGPETRLVYRELLEDAESEAAPPPPPPRTLTYPLVGRQTEWTALVQTWQAAASGQGRMLILRGEAGIGKTRLAEELIDWATAKRLRSATTRCFAGEGRLAYAPIAAWLRAPSMQPALRGLDAVWLSEIARLYPELLQGRQDVAPPEAHLESWQRPRFFEALAHAFVSASPLLLVVDDLQWCDSDTLEWLHFFFRWSEGLRVLVVGTVRSEEESDNPALSVLVRDLARLERLSVLSVGRLDEQATGRLAEAVAERSLEGRDLARVFRQTEGHPLFIVETGRMDLVSGDAPADTLPPRVQAVVAARLVQLSPDARSVAEAAAVVGRDFTFSVLAHVSDLEEDPIVRALDAAAGHPRSGGRPLGFQPRSYSRGGLRPDWSRAPAPVAPARRPGARAAVCRGPRRGQRVHRRALRAGRPAGAGDSPFRTGSSRRRAGVGQRGSHSMPGPGAGARRTDARGPGPCAAGAPPAERAPGPSHGGARVCGDRRRR